MFCPTSNSPYQEHLLTNPSASSSKPGLLSYLAGWKSGSGLGSSSEVDEVVGRFGARGKVIFVTGATSPIAQALCTSLYRHGATVVLGCRGPSSRGEELVEILHTAAAQQQQPQPQQQHGAAPSTSSSSTAHGHVEQQLVSGSSCEAAGTSGAASGVGTASQADSAGGTYLKGADVARNGAVGANHKAESDGVGTDHKGSAVSAGNLSAAAKSIAQEGADAAVVDHSKEGIGSMCTLNNADGSGSNEREQYGLGRLLHVPCDFSCLDGAKACADAFEALGLPLHVLINCVSTISPGFKLTPDNMEEHFGVNYLAPFLLTARLLPLLARSACGSAPTHQYGGSSSSSSTTITGHHQQDCQKIGGCNINSGCNSNIETGGSSSNSAEGSGLDARRVPAHSPAPPAQHAMPRPGDEGMARVVWVSCSAHYITYLPSRGAGRQAALWPVQGPNAGYAYLSPQAYGLSKAAAILGARELANRAAAAGLPIAAFSVHPGVTTDGLKRYGGYSADTWAHKMKAALADGMAAIKALKSHSQAAASIAYAALAPELLAPPSALPRAPSAASQHKVVPAGPTLELASQPGAAALPSQGLREPTAGASAAAVTETAPGAAVPSSLASTSTDIPGLPSTDIPGLIRMPRSPSHAYCEDSNVSKPSPAACDDELACTLWELSESLTSSHLADTMYMECLYSQGIW